MKTRSLIITLSFVLSSACVPKPEAAIDHGTVVAKHSNVRARNGVGSKTIVTLEPGEKVDVLEQLDNWYRIRFGDVQGFMEETTVLTDTTRDHIQKLADESRGVPAQNTARTTNDATLRMEPGRSAAAIRKLPVGVKLDILERKLAPQNDRMQPWFKARISPTEIGWVSGGLIEFDVPEGIAPYTEEHTYTAVKTLKQVTDPVSGLMIPWYVVGERSQRLDAGLDFDGVRVFTWNMSKSRYETAYRLKQLRGVYPLEVGTEDGNPTFRFSELAADGAAKTPRSFLMKSVLVREVKKR